MNLPNKLTVLRIALIPVFMAVLYWGFPGANYAALVIFILASLTDLLDGKIARARNLVTDFGKFADPLADKMLVTAAMLWFVEIGQMPAWALLIVICREFAVSGLRMLASDAGRVIAAGWSGKVKTASTMVCVVLMFLPIPAVLNTVCVWVIVVTTLYSGVEYFAKNKDVFRSMCAGTRAASAEKRASFFGGRRTFLRSKRGEKRHQPSVRPSRASTSGAERDAQSSGSVSGPLPSSAQRNAPPERPV